MMGAAMCCAERRGVAELLCSWLSAVSGRFQSNVRASRDPQGGGPRHAAGVAKDASRPQIKGRSCIPAI